MGFIESVTNSSLLLSPTSLHLSALLFQLCLLQPLLLLLLCYCWWKGLSGFINMTGEPAQLLPECVCVCCSMCVCLCVSACACVTVRVCQKAAAVSYTQCTHGLIWTHSHRHYCGIYGLLFYRIILRVCLQDAFIWSIFLLNWWTAKSLPRCSPHRSHICVLLPSYITTLFTSWAANHQCNFHCPSVVAITSLLLYIHFMIWLICWGSIHPYWLR